MQRSAPEFWLDEGPRCVYLPHPASRAFRCAAAQGYVTCSGHVASRPLEGDEEEKKWARVTRDPRTLYSFVFSFACRSTKVKILDQPLGIPPYRVSRYIQLYVHAATLESWYFPRAPPFGSDMAAKGGRQALRLRQRGHCAPPNA
eukprot:1909476-Prymnesium_polylepis.2